MQPINLSQIEREGINSLYKLARSLKNVEEGRIQAVYILSSDLNNIRKVFNFDLRDRLPDKKQLTLKGLSLKRGKHPFIFANAYNDMGKNIYHHLHLITQIKRTDSK